jgi:hypothetical protein
VRSQSNEELDALVLGMELDLWNSLEYVAYLNYVLARRFPNVGLNPWAVHSLARVATTACRLVPAVNHSKIL